MKCISMSTYLSQLITMVNAKKYRFPCSKDHGGLSANKLHREDKIHLANNTPSVVLYHEGIPCVRQIC